MSFDITEHVPGFSDREVQALATEAEAGYDVQGLPTELNPHRDVLALVPDELREALADRARQDGQSPAAIVREALAAYLHTA